MVGHLDAPAAAPEPTTASPTAWLGPTVTHMAAAGNAGDDGPATAAQLTLPGAVAVTAEGGFLIADRGNNAVRKVAAG